MSDPVLSAPRAPSRGAPIVRAPNERAADVRAPTVRAPHQILVVGTVSIGAVVGLDAAHLLAPGAPVTLALVPVVATLAAALALTVAARAVIGMDRAVRGWVAVAAWCWFLGHAARALTGTSDRLDGGLVANALWVAGFIAATGVALVVSRRLDDARSRSLALDALAVSGAAILGVVVIVGGRIAGSHLIDATLAIVLPALTLSAAGLVILAALARRWRWSFTGVAPAALGIVILGLGLGWIGWTASGTTGPIAVDDRLAISQAIGWLMLAHGVATFRDKDRAGPALRRIAPVVQAAIAAASVVLVAFIATFDEAFISAELWPVALVAIGLTLVAVIVRQVLTARQRERSFGRMSRTVPAARVERRRAEAARAVERERADIASLILAVSEDVRRPEAESSYEVALRRIAPNGCRASIARLDDERTRFTRIASAGPAAADGECTCLTTRMPGDIGDLLHGRVVGRRLDGASPGDGIVATMTPESILSGDARASLTVPIRRPDGWLLGAIHFEDLDGERIHSPAFVALARSTANQLASAFDNADLLERLRREIAERDRIQAQLIQASRAKAVGELAGAVAHEVNNPLTGILGYAELLLADLPVTDERHDDLVVIRDEAKRARSIVRALVDLAENRTGTRTIASLEDVAREAVRAIRGRAIAAAITVTESHAAAPAVAVDQAAIGAVIVALIDNAIAATPAGGTIRVETTAESDRVLLTVIDTGHGMEPDVVRRAFDPFFSTQDARAGRGMGLPIALGVVRDHGGSIWIDSHPGAGTTVDVRLPIAAVLEPDQGLIPATGPGGATEEPETPAEVSA